MGYRFVLANDRQYPILILMNPPEDEVFLLRIPDMKIRGCPRQRQSQRGDELRLFHVYDFCCWVRELWVDAIHEHGQNYHDTEFAVVTYKWRLATITCGGCSETYGECIAASFCEGCHVSHDRKLAWGCVRTAQVFGQNNLLHVKVLDRKWSATISMRLGCENNPRAVGLRRGPVPFASAGELPGLGEHRDRQVILRYP